MLYYVILEGSDLSGKTYLANEIYNKLTSLNITTLSISEPYNKNIIKSNNFKLFKFIKPYLDKRKNYSDKIRQDNYEINELYNLFLKDRLYNYKMLYKLKQHYSNILIIQDRSYISTFVYQQVINNISLSTLLQHHNELLEKYDIRPDIVLYCNPDINTILKRAYERLNKNNLDKLFIDKIYNITDTYKDIILNKMQNNKKTYGLKPSSIIMNINNNINISDIITFLKNKLS